MPAIPAQCTNPKCRAIFPSGFWADNTSHLTLSNNRSQCPVCGSMGMVAEGVFNTTVDTIEVLSAPTTTIDMLKEFEGILRRVRDGQTAPEDAATEAAKLSPKFGALIKAAGSNLALIALLLTILQFANDIWDGHGDAQFQQQMLDHQQQIVTLLEQQAQPTANKSPTQGATSSQKEGLPPSVVTKPMPDRRALVNTERRAKLKAHRLAFGGAAVLHRFRGTPT